MQEEHAINLESQSLKFKSFAEFLAWKEKEESNTRSWYVQRCEPRELNEKQYWYYYCNRAGVHTPQGKGERCIKSQGSSKIIRHCSAHIRAIKDVKTNSVTVHYTPTHYNHKTQLGHLRIPHSTRNIIVSKLKSGVTAQRIIDDIRDNIKGVQLTREHLVSKKDINNIKKQYNIEGIRRHPNDLVSVSTIVSEMEELTFNPVVLFKQQGELPRNDCITLKEEDFVLVIQTEFQRDTLCKFGNNGVCIDATYRINDYDFNLITLMVLDDFQEGIPVMWALSNREDKSVLVSILNAIKQRCGEIEARWFMSDMAQQYYTAWKEVFKTESTAFLWCAWHVDRAWRDGLKRHLTERDQQREIYHQLRVLMMETDKAKFTTLLTQFLSLNKACSPIFTEYFKVNYCSHIEKWATCHRVGTPMNTNMFSEAFHRVLKIVYLGHQHNRRIDYLIYILLRISRDKAFDQLLKTEKGKHSHRTCEINKRHHRAVSSLAKLEKLDNNAYRVTSESKPGEFYTIQTIQLVCTCKIKCQFCSACAHMYSCTCLDACTNTTVCKHMHLVQMKNNAEHIMDTSPCMQESCEYPNIASTSIPLSVVQTGTTSLDKLIEKRLDSIRLHCNECRKTKTLEKVHDLLGVVLEQFMADDSPSRPLKRKAPSHMMSKPQPRFFSTRKKRKTIDNAIDKPSTTETISTQNVLQNTETDVCGICFSEEDKTTEVGHIDWISCSVCDLWVHTSCANETNPENSPEYICLYCS